MLAFQAINQTADPARFQLNGWLGLILLLGVIISVPVSVGLIWLYRRAVLKSMRTRMRPLTSEPPTQVGSTPPDQSIQKLPDLAIVDRASEIPATPAARDLYGEILRGPWRVAAIYVAAGASFALIMASATLVADDLEFLPLRFLLLFWINAWPMVLTVNLVANASRRAKIATVLSYFLALAIFAVILTATGSAPVWSAPVAWLAFNSPGTVVLLALLNQKVRAVGPLVFTFFILIFGGPLVLYFVADSDDRLLRLLVEVGHPLGLGAKSILLGLAVIGFVGAWPIAWLTLKWIRSRYERKKISDQSLMLDAIWFLFGFVQSLMWAANGTVWLLTGLIAFLAYKIVATFGFALIKNKAPTKANARLLLLRVFSLGRRSGRLFDALTKHWRHVGSIQLIAGTDLATDNLEPHEFLDFISAKLARRFIDAPQTLELRMSEMDSRPDRDGRFRVNEFFSHDDTWKHVLSRLVNESDVVLMDLRGFAPQNAGCVYEIAELINVMPLARIQFVIDQTTNEPFLIHCLRQSWDSMRPTSPNRLHASAPLRLFRFTESGMGQLRQLLHSLCIAAKTA